MINEILLLLLLFVGLRKYRQFRNLDKIKLNDFLALRRSRCAKCNVPCYNHKAVMNCPMKTCKVAFHEHCAVKKYTSTLIRCPRCLVSCEPSFIDMTNRRHCFIFSNFKTFLWYKGLVFDIFVVVVVFGLFVVSAFVI